MASWSFEKETRMKLIPRKLKPVFYTFFCFIMFSRLSAFDEKDAHLKYKSFKFLPSLEISPSFDDNVYLKDKNKTHDTSIVIAPALSIKGAPLGKMNLKLDYRLQQNEYLKERDENTTDHDLKFDFQMDFKNKYSLKLEEYLNSSRKMVGYEIPEMSESLLSSSKVTFERLTDLLSFGISGAYDMTEYREKQFENQDSSFIELELFSAYSFSEKTALSFRLSSLEEKYSNDEIRNNDLYSAVIGIKKKVGAFLTFEAEVGWEIKRFDDDESNENYSGFKELLSITYHPLKRLIIESGTQYYVETGEISRYRRVFRQNLSLKYTQSIRWSHGAGVKYDRLKYSKGDKTYLVDVNYNVNYSMLKYMDLKFKYSFVHWGETEASGKYNRNLLSLSAVFYW